ncbi:hypothetical protein MFLAVUS_003492 [Mucor flavus]|uniref:Uncharacterized protein n=1 Tax=Mucor flavus TaxID=439312 RepID=A0ABP9YT77_9FUNG
MVLKDKKYVVGIDFGAISSGLSIAHVDRPHSKFTVNTWKHDFGKTEPKQHLTSILYKANGEIRCGLSNTATDKRRRDEGDIYIDNIKQYILNKDQANEELEQKLKGLTIKKVVSDYLKIFHAVAIERLKKQEDFCNSHNFKEDFKFENLSYCLACPTSLNDFFADCFVEAGIAEKGNLVFVSEAEATAFYCISLDRQTTKIVPDQTYLVFDIGHSSFGISKIKVDSTENLSEVELISEELGKGSMVLENSFRDFLIEKKYQLNLNESIISHLVETFVKEMKFSFDFLQDDYNEDDYNEDDYNKDDYDEEDFDQDDYDEDDYDEDDYDEDEEEEYFDQDDYDEDDFDQEDDKSDKDLVFTLRENSTNEEDFEDEDFEEEDEDDEDNEGQVFKLREDFTEEIIPLFDITNFSGDPINITMDDLEKHVFSPYIDYIANYTMNVFLEDTSKSKILLSGKFCADPNFYKKLSSKYNGRFEQYLSFIEDTCIDAVSLGAVSFGLKVKNVQIPFFQDANSNLAGSEQQKNVGSSEKLKTEHVYKEFDFIVGIDFGTTFTGCSYANPRDVQVNGDNAIHDINASWPGGYAVAYGKVPTLIMYDKKMKTKSWGQEAKQNAQSYKDLNLLSNFKCFPYPETVEAQYGVGNRETATIKENNSYMFNSFINTSQTPHKAKKYSATKRIDPHQVCADYLKEVKEHVIRHIVAETKFKKGKKGVNLFSKSSENHPRIQFVLTVPDYWAESARESMVQIAIEATIIKEDELDDLLIISELEAAALFCEKKYSDLIRDPEHPDTDSHFIICDVGAQTVDLATFHWTHNQENGDATLYQIGNGIGDTCGSNFVDRAFKDYLVQFYKDSGLEVNESNTNFFSVMEDFTSSIKHNFWPDSDRDSYCDIKLPAERIMYSIPNTREAKQYTLLERNTKLRIKHTVIKGKIFDPIITKILTLIQRQLDQSSKINTKISTIMLVGGFSRNPYLQQRIQDEFRSIYDVKFPEEGAAAISRGAVSYGLKPRLISGKRVNKSIALEVRTPFEKLKWDRLDKKVYRHSSDKVYSKNCLEYFVNQSDNLQGLKFSHRTVTVDYPNNALIAVFACYFKEEDDRENWRYVSKRHTKILEEIIKLPEVEEINEGDPVHFNVGLQIDHIGATVIVECQNRFINRKIKEITNGEKTSLNVVRKCDLIVMRNKKSLAEYSLAKNSFWSR